MSNETAVAKRDDVGDVLSSMIPELQKIAPSWFSAERVVQLMLTTRANTPALRDCSKESLVGFMLKMAQTGFEQIGPGGAWPVPFNNRHTGKKEITFIPDYRGLIWSGKRNEVITHGYAEIVREGDEFSIEKGDTPRCMHKPNLAGTGDVIGAYAVLVLPDGTKHIEWMSITELEKTRNSSKAKDSGPWVDWREEQYKKTVLKRAMKLFAGGNPRLQTAIQLDNDALGLAAVDRTPIAEPKEIKPESVSEPKPQQKAPQATQPAQEPPKQATTKPAAKPVRKTQPPKDDDSSLPTLTFIPKVAGSKATSNGKTKYFAKLDDGTWINAWDSEIGEALVRAKESHSEITVRYKENQYGRDVVEIVGPEAQDTQGNTDAESREEDEQRGGDTAQYPEDLPY